MTDPYEGREQTQAKHFILKSYLQELAFKILNRRDEISYVDGFSGPWHQRTEDFSDTSFKIAIDVLKDAQQWFWRERGKKKIIRCFLVEKDPTAYQLLEKAVSGFHDPEGGFLVETRGGKFEDAIPHILRFVGSSFTLTFIDPTGWKGYDYSKVGPLLRRQPGEVLINFMYDFIVRFAPSEEKKIEESLEPILGGPGWKGRLDQELPTGQAVEKLYRQELERAGRFEFVLSTCIKKSTINRAHFFIAYGTRSEEGLKAFREVEARALRKYEQSRTGAKISKREQRSGMADLFGASSQPEDTTVVEEVEQFKQDAKPFVIDLVETAGNALPFRKVRTSVMKVFRLRETDVKDVCVSLAEEGRIKTTWKERGGRKPDLNDIIALQT